MSRFKTNDAALRDYKRFASQFKGFITFMGDMETLDSLEKAASEAEAARATALAETDKIKGESNTILENAKGEAEKVLNSAKAQAKSIEDRAETEAGKVMSGANARADNILDAAGKQAEELNKAAKIENDRLQNEIKKNTAKAKAATEQAKLIDDAITVKQSTLNTIEKKLADLRQNLG